MGTGLCGTRLRGNIVCVNSSFSSCVRTSNAVIDHQHKNISDTSVIRRTDVDVTSKITSVQFSSCTFNEMTLSGEYVSSDGGAAIRVDEAHSTLTVTQCFFHKCTTTKYRSDGGAICVWEYSLDYPVFLSLCSFTECENTGSMGTGGSVFCDSNSTVALTDCFLEESYSQDEAGALILNSHSLATLSNCAFVSCSSIWAAGALGVFNVDSIDFSFLQFRDCSSTNRPETKDLYFGALNPLVISLQLK
ncbi:hypothetical protein BLNAU_10131 [Blattamonas nauphoetae]|uniref:Right handed beta helix domain-containing protein n=1 Tax=Blattamonas nauphoetae TaxID=2049346 RepID=A0ABQ9XU41_9EUKA|nr:hypothetical protein BLNAU_10131 [Blattamonas nauphoetae]